MELNKIYNEDCMVGMKCIPDRSVDMILCDLPYGTTACAWDTIIPFEPLWEQYERVIKDNGAIVLTASQPFTSVLVSSNLKLFRYEWIWLKSRASLFQHARKMPMKRHENVLVFYKKLPTFNLDLKKLDKKIKSSRKTKGGDILGEVSKDKEYFQTETGFKFSDIGFANPNNKNIHPTQKPVPLFEYLIKTYTNEGETVLDNCMGSGTTAIACMNTDRNYIGFELDETYYEKSLERIKNHATQTDIFNLLEGE